MHVSCVFYAEHLIINGWGCSIIKLQEVSTIQYCLWSNWSRAKLIDVKEWPFCGVLSGCVCVCARWQLIRTTRKWSPIRAHLMWLIPSFARIISAVTTLFHHLEPHVIRRNYSYSEPIDIIFSLVFTTAFVLAARAWCDSFFCVLELVILCSTFSRNFHRFLRWPLKTYHFSLFVWFWRFCSIQFSARLRTHAEPRHIYFNSSINVKQTISLEDNHKNVPFRSATVPLHSPPLMHTFLLPW